MSLENNFKRSLFSGGTSSMKTLSRNCQRRTSPISSWRWGFKYAYRTFHAVYLFKRITTMMYLLLSVACECSWPRWSRNWRGWPLSGVHEPIAQNSLRSEQVWNIVNALKSAIFTTRFCQFMLQRVFQTDNGPIPLPEPKRWTDRTKLHPTLLFHRKDFGKGSILMVWSCFLIQTANEFSRPSTRTCLSSFRWRVSFCQSYSGKNLSTYPSTICHHSIQSFTKTSFIWR